MADQPTQVIERVTTPEPTKAPAAPPKLTLPRFAFKIDVSAGVWVGLGLAALGFGAIFYSWVRVAALLDVGRQMPYVVSGAMTGLGLIVVGIGVVDVAVRRQDRLERRHQLNLMQNLLEELREASAPPADSPGEAEGRK